MTFDSVIHRLKEVSVLVAIVAVSDPQGKKEKLKSH
jgi:hypothetical protein